LVIRYADWQLTLLEEAKLECLDADRVARNFDYQRWVSKSKGGCRNKIVKVKNGKIYGPYPHYGPYKRKNWKDVELVSYRDRGYHLWDNFPFDEYASEVLPGFDEWVAVDEIQERLRRLI
jgi:hypothetical protein